MILNAFKKWLNKSVKIYTITNTTSQDDASVTESEVLKVTLLVGFYEGSSAEQFISDKFRAKIDGVFIINPPSLNGITILDTDKMVLENSRTFRTVHSDDVMMWGQMLVIGVREDNDA